MLNPNSWQSHNEYRTIVTKIGRRLSRNNAKYSFDAYEEEQQKLLNLNLDPQNTGHKSCAPWFFLSCFSIFNKTKARTSLTFKYNKRIWLLQYHLHKMQKKSTRCTSRRCLLTLCCGGHIIILTTQEEISDTEMQKEHEAYHHSIYQEKQPWDFYNNF